MSFVNIIKDIRIKYPDLVICEAPLNEVNDRVPEIFKSIYTFANGINLPFGSIFSLDDAINKSKRLPFSPDWFVFGYDNYFTYWLCRYSPDGDLWITTWDHESGNDIEEAVWPDLIEFLVEMLEEYEY